MIALQIPPSLDRGAFGWDAVKLADVYPSAALAAAIGEIHADPAAANPEHAAGRSIQIYTKAAKKRTEALAWAIFYQKQAASRAKAGAA
ncbi:hypothetical protein [Stenotrophomonas maltophilia]|uniref:hypothetical protein n=1 Tax=Stenotrophomonas maltophilia TaxID=40324 RepID=UPI0039C47F05